MAEHRHLLYTDFDGRPLDTPVPLLGRGLVDDRHLARVPGLAAVLDDPTAHPYDRLYACLALTTWGEERGYRAVVAAAAVAPPWQGPRRAASATPAMPRAPFGLIAAQVGISDAMAARKGTEAARLAALRALVGVADREDFDDQLGAAIFTGPPHELVPDVVATTRRGLRRLDRRPWPPFDLPCQLVDILEPLVEVDEPTALALVGEILRRDRRVRTLGYVAFLVATGTTPAADALAAHIVAVGGPAVAERLAAGRLR
jgi:hypothetical protein